MNIQRLAAEDTAIVALRSLEAGQTVSLEGESWTLLEPVPAKHKFAARDFAAGETVTMYGVTVGVARNPILRGGRLTTDNLAHAAAAVSGQRERRAWQPPDVTAWQGRTFNGYRRADGPAGTANYWIVVPLVFCENRNLAFMREALREALGADPAAQYRLLGRRMADAWRSGGPDMLAALELSGPAAPEEGRLFPNVDGVKFLEHGLGCGGTRQDADALCGLLAGYINHPNVAGATVLSLGCQNAQVSLLERELARRNPNFHKPLHIFEQQKSQSERDLMTRALRDTFCGIADASELRREPCPVSDLVIGVKCGGSDGFSGLSANPVVGHVSDLLAALGGAPVLAEFPELCGVEQELCDRCETPELAARFLSLMNAYAKAAAACGSGFDSNPSPGNIADGLTTDAMKSAGAARKGGTVPINAVLDYPEPVTTRGGLVLYCTPGNDVECTSALSGAGCTLILFTTGLGTPTGNPVCPTLKISTNSELARRMGDLIDFDAGPVIKGSATIAALGDALFKLTLATASGEYTPQAVRLGQDDFLPWKRGISL